MEKQWNIILHYNLYFRIFLDNGHRTKYGISNIETFSENQISNKEN